MRNHAQLKHQPKHTFENLQLLVIHKFAQFYYEVFEIGEISVVFQKFDVSQEDQWPVDHRVGDKSNEICQETTTNVIYKYSPGFHFVVTFEEVQDDIGSLNETDIDVVGVVVDEAFFCSRQE